MPRKKKTEDEILEEESQEEEAEEETEEDEYEPILMYKSPGPHQAPGGTFSYKQICCPEDGEAALKDGWCLSVEEAVKKTLAE